MKVICIDAKKRHDEFDGPSLIEGNVYTAVKTCRAYGTTYHEYVCYQLAEIPYPHLFDTDRFIECSEIDERELVNETKVHEIN